MPQDCPRKTSTSLIDHLDVSEKQRQKFRESKSPFIRGNIPLEERFDGQMLEIYSVDRSKYTHGFHKFPAKYIPEIPRWGILKFSKENDTVIDPFCGSGTTNVEAILNRRNSYALDVDPVALLLTKVKTTPLNGKELRRSRDSLVRAIYSSENESEIPEFPNRDYWFKPEVSHELGIITSCIEMIGNQSERDFFLVCLSSILKEVSNADSKFLYALAISRKMRQQKNRKIDVRKTFVHRLKELIPKMAAFSRKCPRGYFARVLQMDARKMELHDESIDLGVTSPPYCNAVDYPRAHQLQIYWFGLWDDKLSELKKRYVGTEQVLAEDYSKLHKSGNSRLDEILERIYEVDKRRSFVVYKYFMDMKENFLEVKRLLKPECHYVVAVADNIVRKVSVPTHLILTDIAEEVGFELVDSYGSVLMMRPHNMRKSEKMNVEWVMALRKGS